MKRFWRKNIILSLVVVLVIGSAGYYFLNNRKTLKAVVSTTENIVTASKGEIRSTVSGTSQFEAKNMQTISAPSDGTIKTMNLSRNLAVKKGDLLFEVSNPDLEVALQKAQLTMTQLQNNHDDLLQQQQALVTVAPMSGKLTYALNLDVASQVVKTTKIATISDTSTLSVTLPFLLEDAVQLKAGDSVDLSIDGYMLTKTGTIQTISKTPGADANGNKIINIIINVANDNTLEAGTKVKGSVNIQGVTKESQGQGIFEITKTSTVLANTSGIIAALKFKSGDTVNKGDIISSVASDSLNDNLLAAEAAIEQQKVSINDLQDKVNSLKVTAPFDGVFSTDFVNQKTNVLSSYPVGAKVVSATQFGGVSSLDNMQLSIQVDELDLPSIKDKMQANVKVDSVTGQNFQGEVNQISTVGTTTNGVTFYTVVLSVPNTKQLLKYGMTATAEILVQDKKDIVLIPIEALQSRQGKRYVTLKKADGTNETKEVTIGIRSKTMLEVTSGLNEGDKLVTPVLQKQAQGLSQTEIDAIRRQFQQNGGAGGAGGAGGGTAGNVGGGGAGGFGGPPPGG